ncbi:bifunctional GTP diphosphokinase/guanosine-3',5'-bis(diphosphate) 3'-diphosphatase [Spirochaetia bacterium]|nr:bifunctional GTP diphosphokinase/guanosine-3',5'-bis(diphosphate) 3'-diphosphatase [Spirochaetia bacterium]
MDSQTEKFKEKIAIYEKREQDRILQAMDLVGKNTENLAAAAILAELNLDCDTVTAALLQNIALPPGKTVEDRFGHQVSLLTEGIARITGIAATNKTQAEAENIRNMLFAMVRDIRVIFIKLAERLHRMRTAEDLPPEEQKIAAQECLDIYAPLASRLGISWIKDELEDLSLKYINREAYTQIKKLVSEKRSERQDFLKSVQEEIEGETAAAGIKVEVSSRAKHFYSIYQKIRKRNKAAGDIYDLLGLRILCDSIANCYTLLGLVHRLWKPLEGRFKDYIAMPKSNGYQSLHTTVMAPGGRLLEIQIRTEEMHHIAEYGIASHWLYKQSIKKMAVRPTDITIVNRIKDWKQQEADAAANAGADTGADADADAGEKSSEAFLEEIKKEILKDSIYVFTPQGKVIELPAGATPIDFAYSIHSAVGDHCMGAKADGAIIPLASELSNTQVVEILTSTQARPHINWLRIVKTAKARSKIRAWLQQNDDSVIIEKNVVAKKKAPAEKPAEPAPVEKEVLQVLPSMAAGEAGFLQVKVEDEKNMMIRFAKCCKPVTGDPIIGYVSRGRGIIVHRKDCRSLAHINDFEERKIETQWENADVMIKRFKIEARGQAELFSEIEGAVRKHQGHLIEGRLEETGDLRSNANHLTGFFTMQLEMGEDLKRVMKNIRNIPGVLSIQSLG